MKISGTTTDTVLDIKEFSGGKLKNEHDISLLIEASSGREKLFGDTSFTAKYLNGLGKILHSANPAAGSDGSSTPLTASKTIDEDAKDKIRTEFSKAMMKLTLQLSEIIKDIPADDKKDFEDKYLAMNRTALVNLTTLIYDLSWVKKYLNAKP
jgi:hypothetical protein